LLESDSTSPNISLAHKRYFRNLSWNELHKLLDGIYSVSKSQLEDANQPNDPNQPERKKRSRESVLNQYERCRLDFIDELRIRKENIQDNFKELVWFLNYLFFLILSSKNYFIQN
jgi:hypothetical protein